MPDRPLILFPTPERADRETKPHSMNVSVTPTAKRQFSRLQPTFKALKTAFDQKKIRLQQSAAGISPELALVFEIVGTVESFYTAVKYTPGLEWMFEAESDPFEADEDFFQVNAQTQERVDSTISGRLYCVMTNQQALLQLLSLWRRYQNGETDVFKGRRGFAGIRDVFTHIKSIRKWGAEDRIAETYAVEYWRESLQLDGNDPVPFEIELFYRSNADRRVEAVKTISKEVESLHGRILQDCVISEIQYHGMLVELPRASIEDLIVRYEEISLSQVDDIMFFRPTCQSSFVSPTDCEESPDSNMEADVPSGEAVVAILDGMPMQNHHLLRERLIIDDPDDYAANYESKYRIHGTSMASFVIYGDLNSNDPPISTPVYMRPILKPKLTEDGHVEETVPENVLFVDLLHRAVKRMAEGEGEKRASAPSVKVVNLSVGDPVRQLAGTMSPAARLLDYLSFKYNILFIISAGNHREIVQMIPKTFSELKSIDLSERNSIFGDTIKENQRNLRVLSPAESLNGLTIGALYDDYSNATETAQWVLAVEKGLPSPISAIGKGYRSVITPDLFYNGGRKYIRGKVDGSIDWVDSSRTPGCLSAAPYGAGDSDGRAYSYGTSDAAAQITHEAAKCNDILNQVFLDETGTGIPSDAVAILLKAMLTHGASWDHVAGSLSRSMKDSEKKLSKWIGNGIPDISRVIECTKERVTLVGLGKLGKDEGNVFKLPLAVDFSSRLMKRKLTVTLAYLSPIASEKQSYRGVSLWFSVNDGGKGLVPNRQNTDWRAVRKGTLQHEIFTGEGPIPWNDDDLIIKVNCKEEAVRIKTPIPYCLFVSFEVAEGFDIDLYAEVSSRIRERVPI